MSSENSKKGCVWDTLDDFCCVAAKIHTPAVGRRSQTFHPSRSAVCISQRMIMAVTQKVLNIRFYFFFFRIMEIQHKNFCYFPVSSLSRHANERLFIRFQFLDISEELKWLTKTYYLVPIIFALYAANSDGCLRDGKSDEQEHNNLTQQMEHLPNHLDPKSKKRTYRKIWETEGPLKKKTTTAGWLDKLSVGYIQSRHIIF